jgi:hypothetical protein
VRRSAGKAKLALEDLKRLTPVNELVGQYKVHPTAVDPRYCTTLHVAFSNRCDPIQLSLDSFGILRILGFAFHLRYGYQCHFRGSGCPVCLKRGLS